MEYQEAYPGAVERTGPVKERLARLLACGVFALGLFGCDDGEPALARPDVPQFTYGSEVPRQTAPHDTPGPLMDMAAVIVDDPSRDNRHVFTDEPSVRRVFRSADIQLAETTNNQISLPNDLPIERKEVWPTGKVGDVMCYDHDDLRAVDGKVAGDGVLLLLDETPGCDEITLHQGLVREAWAYEGTKTVVFGNKTTLRVGTINHEIGHVLSLTHHTVVGQLYQNGERKMYAFDHRPIDKRLKNPEFKTAQLPNGEINEYAATSSVMGNSQKGGVPGEVYHPLELAKIGDEVRIPTVGTEPATYALAAEGAGTRGVKISLPKDHPLRKIDGDMESVSFSTVPIMTPGAGHIDKIDIMVTAASPRELYDIYALPPINFYVANDSRGDHHGERWRTVYEDEALGTTVEARWPQHGEVQLRVTPYA